MGLFSFVKPGKKVFEIVKPKIAKNLTTKRNIQDKVVKAVDEGVKKADVPQSVKDSQKTKQSSSKTKREKSRELKGLSYRLDKLTEKATGGRVGKMGGGMMGRRFGMKKGTPKPKTNVEKIKETFASKSGLKKIDPKKQKGLAKLKKARPDVVRKMGYMKRGGRA